jgi:hypothetical protein
MNHEPGNILKQLETELKEYILNSFFTWYQTHSNYLIPLQSIINRYKIQLTKKNNIIEHWQIFEEKAAEALAWLGKIDHNRKTMRLTEICSQFDEKVEQLLQTLPVELKSFIQPNIWKPNTGDKIPTKIKKKVSASLHKSIKIIKKIIRTNYIKNGDSTNGNIHFERIIPLHLFIKNYLARPLHRFIISQWQNQMHTISGQLLVLHLKTKEFNNKALCLDKLPTLLHEQKESEIFEIFYDLAEILRTSEETLQILNGWENQFTNKLDLTWKEISQSFVNTWQIAGTSQLPNRKYSHKKIAKRKELRQNKIQKFQQAWNTHFTGIFEEWRKDFELAILQYQALLLMEMSDKQIAQWVDLKLLPSITNIKETINNTVLDFKSSQDEETFQKMLTVSSSDMLKQIQKEKLPHLLDSLHQIRVENTEHAFTQTLKDKIENLSEESTFFAFKDTKNVPPKSKTEAVPLKQIIKNNFLKNLNTEHNRYTEFLEQKIETILRTTTEIDQIIEFNFDTAITYMKFKNGDPDGFLEAKKNLLHGLEQAFRLTENISGDTQNLKKDGIAHFDKTILSFEQKIMSLNEDQLQNLKSHTGENVNDSIPQAPPEESSESQDTLPDAQTEDTIQTFDYISAFAAQMAKLPYTYARLFTLEPLQDDRFYLERKYQTSQIEQAFNNWKKGNRTLTLLTGACGSGRKTFINYTVQKSLHSRNIVRIKLEKRMSSELELVNELCSFFVMDKVDTLDELSSEIQKGDKPCVAIFEELQCLFVSTVEGFDLLQQFISFILGTQSKIFWIIISENHALRYLNKILDISKFFQTIITMDNLPAHELDSILLKRHRISGYDLHFYPNTEYAPSKNNKKLSEDSSRQSFYKKIFFEHLNQYAQGNITVGLLYWLWSIRNFQDDKLVLATGIEVDFNAIERLNRSDLLLINTILQHGALSAQDCAQIFRADSNTISINMQKLQQLGLFISINDRYSLQPFLIPALINTLQKNKLNT